MPSKYSDSHTPIAVEMTAYELFVRISVTDSGQALAAEEYAQVFSASTAVKRCGNRRAWGWDFTSPARYCAVKAATSRPKVYTTAGYGLVSIC